MHLMDTNEYTDVTDKFKKDAKTLAPGQIASTPTFTLEQAISAFELGNPKMDTGLDFRPFQREALNYPRSTNEICHAIDSLVCREVSWLSGSTLVQTVFSGLFVEQELQRLKDPNILHSEYLKSIDPKVKANILQVYVLATLKSCGLVVECMRLDDSGVIALEEDFHIDTAGWSLLEEVNMDLVLEMLDKAIGACESPDLRGIQARFQFRREILNVFHNRITNDHIHINKALELLRKGEVEEGHGQRSEAHSPAQNEELFGTGIQARSDWFCLQRPLRSTTFAKASEFYSALLNGLKDASSILKITKSSELLGFFHNFAKQNHTPLLRVMVKSVFTRYSLMGFSPQVWAENDISELSFPGLASIKQEIIQSCAAEWEAFMSQAPSCYIDLLTCLCVNRCHQRKLMFEAAAAWDSLQVAAQALDHAIVRGGTASMVHDGNKKMWALEFSSWVYQRKLQIMLWSFLMGFEQDLFSPWEASSMYWYAKHVAEVLVSQLVRLKTYFQERSYRQTPGYQYIVAMEVEARCLEHLCTASWLINLVFEGRGLLKRPSSAYASPELTFGLRLESFESIGIPPAPSYADFAAESKVYSGDEELALKTVKANISGAQAFLKAISQVAGPTPEVQTLKRSAFGLSAMVLKLSKGVDKITFVKEGNHPYFPVPQ